MGETPTGGDIRVQLHIMCLAVKGSDIHLKVAEDERLASQILGGDGRQEGDLHFHGISHIHGEDALGRGVLELSLVHGETSGQAHPCVRSVINTNQAGPAGDLTSAVGNVVSTQLQRPDEKDSLPEGRPFAGQVSTIATRAASGQPSAQVRRFHRQWQSRGPGWAEG